MSTKKDSDDLLRVGPGTPIGELMRQYWIPAAMSSELERDGAPTRLLLLGERLIAFRDSAGRVGIMDQRCPHRCASLFLGRNEEGGLRCVYHGWKFDAEGNCVDMPNTPPHQDYKAKVRAKAYRTFERNGLVWVYMGARAEAPPLPGIEAALLPEGDLQIVFAQRECNWLQALEGDIDTSHFGFLHAGSVDPESIPSDNLIRWTVANRAPQYHVTDTDYGTMYAAYRPASAGRTYWRFANFLFPFWTQTPQGAFDRVNSRAWVPMDDGHTMFVSLSWNRLPAERAALSSTRGLPGSKLTMDFLPNTTDWYGRWRLAGNEANDWLIDREAQRHGGIFTGIVGIQAQDQAITESMGPVTDHGFENLGPSDIIVARTRRRLLRAARAFKKDGTVPPGVDDPETCLAVRSGDFLADAKTSWRDAYAIQMRTALRPLAQAAE
jgi:phenylpropionate dioxygenase-like ring-hydroxylating dioxygenase large terminal subunit